MRSLFVLLFIPTLFFCRHLPDGSTPTVGTPVMEKIDILALGDSYTKGESVPWAQNFPNQLVDSLRLAGFEVQGLKILAETGWRTDNLQAAINNQSSILKDSVFSLVTLCIGVNNQYQHADFEAYKQQFIALLQYAISRAGGQAKRVFVLSIPDWSYTPYGQGWGDPATTAQEIDQYNLANKTISDSFGVFYVNVTDVSRQGLQKPELVAFDGLHPSAQQYTAWLNLMLPDIKATLKP